MAARKLSDDYLHLGHRRRLVQALRNRGIDNERVLAAIGQVPRHWFVDKAYEHLAYEDRALPIPRGQTISQPYTVAFQSSLLEAEENMKILEVGTGSGYQAAVLGKLGLRVFTLERQEPLYASARILLSKQRFGKVRCFLRDGYKGLPVYGPYDRILVTAAAPEVPEALLSQLAVGGHLVIPVGTDQQSMLRVRCVQPGEFVTEEHGTFKFVPFQEGIVATEH